MSISFEGGKQFPNERVRRTELTAARLRQGIVATSQYLDGEAILVPPINNLAEHLGLSSGAFYSKGSLAKDYSSVVEYATGLTVIKRPALVLVNNETTIEPLSNHIPAEPEGLSQEEAVSVAETITRLAQSLPEDMARQIGEALIQDQSR
jgi:hypothetical protein